MLIPEAGVSPRSERYFFTPSSLALELFYYPTRCGHYFCDHLYSFSHSSHIAQEGDHNRNIMLFLIQAGAMELTLSGKTVLSGAGQVVLFDCHNPYRYTASDGLEFTWLLFNGLNVREYYRRILQGHSGRPCFSLPAGSEIPQILGGLLRSCAADEAPSEADCSQMIHRLLCLLLLGEHPRPRDPNDSIAQAIRYMNQHLLEPLSVQQVAQAVNLSASHFSRQFKARTGYSPYEYIVLRRIDRAKYLLTSTRQSIKEIAYQIGYNSEENFIHSFQKHVGISPGLFRKYPI